jgi:epoxyqueuosine reductase
MNIQELSSGIKKVIINTGASECGFAKAEKLQREYEFLKRWVGQEFHAGKTYLEQNPELRADPEMLVPGAKTVIAALFNYFNPDTLSAKQHYRISRYAYGRDYHQVVKEKMNVVAEYIKQHTGSLNTRVFVDSAPIFEKAWAQRAGLGWIGKNSLLVNKNTGTFHFIGVIVTDVELQYDTPVEEKCGNCKLCIEACPTSALIGPHELDVRKCLSHLNMEQKNPLDDSLKDKFNHFIYGCDLCQEACPWNKNLKPCSDTPFQLLESLNMMSKEDWENLTEEKFLEITENSAMRRVGYTTIKRNIDFLKEI